MEDSDQESLGSNKSPQIHNNTVNDLDLLLPQSSFCCKGESIFKLKIKTHIVLNF